MNRVGIECLGVTMLAIALWLLPETQRPSLGVRPQSAPEVDVARAEPPRPDPWSEAMVFDLLAACSTAGMSLSAAAAAVAAAVPTPLSTTLRRGTEAMNLGADPATVWHGSDIADLTGLMRRSLRCGSSLSDGLTELAAHRRESARERTLARAQRMGVLIAGPLGLCFLPAFLCLGVLPTVIGLAGKVLGGQA